MITETIDETVLVEAIGTAEPEIVCCDKSNMINGTYTGDPENGACC